MEIFPKDSLPAPEGWERRTTGNAEENRAQEKEMLEKMGQKKAGRIKIGEKVTVQIIGRNRGHPW